MVRYYINKLPIGFLKFLVLIMMVVGGTCGMLTVGIILLYFSGGGGLVSMAFEGQALPGYDWLVLLSVIIGVAIGAPLGMSSILYLAHKDKRYLVLGIKEKDKSGYK